MTSSENQTEWQAVVERHLIGELIGDKPGPLFICMAAVHGNENAGVEALKTVFQLLEVEPTVNPAFSYRGTFLGLLGNAGAFLQSERFISRDLNRLWLPDLIGSLREKSANALEYEYRELRELIDLIKYKIRQYNPPYIVLLDLHTTSAQGGIFAIATDRPESIRIAMELHAPVVTGMLQGISGTSLHYFIPPHFGRPVTAVAFEAGQHNDPLSINRSIAAIINCMRSIRAVCPEDVENRHDQLLIEYSKDLPRIVRLISAYHIRPEERFIMQPGFRNFHPVKKGQLLAKNSTGNIYSADDGLLLMPLYQPLGTDGFFLVQEGL